ncbi:GNAT family N-acetyltransferase [Litorisediminicola beolgyonensis]|uniref:GNAT family N-acetyltransferase n=1 Tax=Litorisediminicola beolgyonensis TaxID=1173614 RepID=A0ABW3ZFU0_9RHOB
MTPDALAALLARAYRHQTPWTASQLAETLSLPTSRLYASDCAALLVQIVADEAEILALATDPASARRGEASALLTAFHEEATSDGVARVFLDVAHDNAPARGLYVAHGYAPIATRKGYYRRADGSHVDAVVLQRRLDGQSA